METISEHSTLAEIVNLRPGSARVLESYELDYCCHGQRPLSEACEASGTDPGAVLESVRSAHDVSGGPGDRAWLDMQAGPLAAHIESTHHRYLHEEMPRLDALAEKVASVHGERHPELRTLLETYRELTADLQPHLVKEERVLFPMIQQLQDSQGSGTTPEFHCGSLQNPISVMLAEHDTAGELLARMRQLSAGYEVPADACASYTALYEGLSELEADTHLHIHKENNVMFPMVLRMEL